MKNVLIVEGHRDSKNDSVANKQIIEDLRELLPDAEISILDELYQILKLMLRPNRKNSKSQI